MVTPDQWAKAVFSIVNKCTYPGYRFSVAVEGQLVVLRVVFAGPDVTDEHETQMGRPWVIEFGSHPPQIIATAFKAVLTSLEHRARESFGYGGLAVMSPHRTMAQLLGSPPVGPEVFPVPEHPLRAGGRREGDTTEIGTVARPPSGAVGGKVGSDADHIGISGPRSDFT